MYFYFICTIFVSIILVNIFNISNYFIMYSVFKMICLGLNVLLSYKLLRNSTVGNNSLSKHTYFLFSILYNIYKLRMYKLTTCPAYFNFLWILIYLMIQLFSHTLGFIIMHMNHNNCNQSYSVCQCSILPGTIHLLVKSWVKLFVSSLALCTKLAFVSSNW